MATDDEQAVHFEDFRKQFFSGERGMIFSEHTDSEIDTNEERRLL